MAIVRQYNISGCGIVRGHPSTQAVNTKKNGQGRPIGRNCWARFTIVAKPGCAELCSITEGHWEVKMLIFALIYLWLAGLVIWLWSLDTMHEGIQSSRRGIL